MTASSTASYLRVVLTTFGATASDLTKTYGYWFAGAYLRRHHPNATFRCGHTCVPTCTLCACSRPSPLLQRADVAATTTPFAFTAPAAPAVLLNSSPDVASSHHIFCRTAFGRTGWFGLSNIQPASDAAVPGLRASASCSFTLPACGRSDHFMLPTFMPFGHPPAPACRCSYTFRTTVGLRFVQCRRLPPRALPERTSSRFILPLQRTMGALRRSLLAHQFCGRRVVRVFIPQTALVAP